MRYYQDKVVFVTGASSGIGQALAVECAQQGAAVVVTGRRLDRLEDLAARLQSRGCRALAYQLDVTHESALEQAVAATLAHFGRLDVVVANAGFGVAGLFEALTLDDYRRQLETNLFGVLTTLKASLSELKRTRGHFAIMGSVAGYLGVPGGTPYSMSKFAVRGFAEGVRPELAQEGVSLTLLTPGFVESEIRRVDNAGTYHADAPDHIPRFLQMPAPEAARQMARAIERRKPEAIITAHGRLMVTMANHFPGLTRFLLSRFRRGEDKSISFSTR